MTSVRVRTIYENDKTYPILVKMGGGYKIVEMTGEQANRDNGVSTPYSRNMMNSRIKELAEQAGFDYEKHAYFIDRFAESLIHECATVCATPACGRESSSYALLDNHFYPD